MHDSVAETVSRPGEDEQERDVDHVLTGESLAVDLGGDEAADEVVTGVSACLAAVELGVEVLHHLRVGRHAVVVVGRTDDAVLEPQEEREIVEGQPELGEEDLGGERFAERAEEVDLAVGRERVDQLVGQRAHARLERGDHLRCEQRVEQLAVPGVRVAVEHQRDERPPGTHVRGGELDHDGIHRVHVAPLRHGQHVGHAHDGDAAVVVAHDSGPVQQPVHVRLDVDDPVDEGPVPRRSGSHCLHAFPLRPEARAPERCGCALQRR